MWRTRKWEWAGYCWGCVYTRNRKACYLTCVRIKCSWSLLVRFLLLSKSWCSLGEVNVPPIVLPGDFEPSVFAISNCAPSSSKRTVPANTASFARPVLSTITPVIVTSNLPADTTNLVNGVRADRYHKRLFAGWVVFETVRPPVPQVVGVGVTTELLPHRVEFSSCWCSDETRTCRETNRSQNFRSILVLEFDDCRLGCRHRSMKFRVPGALGRRSPVKSACQRSWWAYFLQVHHISSVMPFALS